MKQGCLAKVTAVQQHTLPCRGALISLRDIEIRVAAVSKFALQQL